MVTHIDRLDFRPIFTLLSHCSLADWRSGMEPIPEGDVSIKEDSDVADFELGETPSNVSEHGAKRAKMIDGADNSGMLVQSSPCTSYDEAQAELRRSKLREHRSALSGAASAASSDTARRLLAAGGDVRNRRTRREEPKATSQQLAGTLGSAIHRLESKSLEQDHRLRLHEQVMAAQKERKQHL